MRLTTRLFFFLAAILVLGVCAQKVAGASPEGARAHVPSLEELPLREEVTQHDITWYFERKVRVGRFVNGDYYVAGPVRITRIEPAPGGGRNGSMLNLRPSQNQYAAFDDRTSGRRYRAELGVEPPIELKPGDMLMSSKSAPKKRGHLCLFGLERNISPVWSYSVLTCLEAPVAADAFRPGYCDRKLRLYYAGDLQWRRLHNLEHVEHTPEIDRWAQLYRQPWLDLMGFCFNNAAEYQPQYAREIVRAEAFATLLLNLDFPKEKKRPLLINFVQHGIDLWSIIRDGENEGWKANGGHGSGRKWAIVFGGMMLGDEEMACPSRSRPEVKFGQDMQTMYGDCWTGAEVVYAGHRGVWKGKPVASNPAQMPYEHLHPSKWAYNTFQYANRAKPTTQYEGEVYRRTVNSPAWVGVALAGRIMHAEGYYAHDAFFDYVDRWMTEDDGPLREEIMRSIDAENTAHDFREQKFRAGRSWDVFVKEMWDTYRKNLPLAQR